MSTDSRKLAARTRSWRQLLVTLAAACALAGAGKTTGPTTVRFVLRDASTGKITPAVVSITGADGKVRLPPDGRPLSAPSTPQDFIKGIAFSKNPGWIGPVRDTRSGYLGRSRTGQLDEVPAIPYWHEPVMFQVPGKFSIVLPPGRWRIAVARGKEYVPAIEKFTLSGEPEIQKTIALERWIDLPARGWWSGDVHVHIPSVTPAQREYVLAAAEASDLHVVNLLEMGHHWASPNDFKQAGFGKKFRMRRGDYCFVSGQEEPRGLFGHIIGLNIQHFVRDLTNYDWYDLAFDRIHAQDRALVGFGHFAVDWTLMQGFPWWVTTGDLDYVELLQFGRINTLDYYDYLNLGFKLTAAAGSDVPYGAVLGEVRTYVHTGPKLDIDAWFEGLRKGNTFVSNGPALEFTVDGKLPGSEIARAAGDRVRIAARASGHSGICIPRALTIAGNNGVLKEVNNPGDERELAASFRREIDRSQWIVAGTICRNGAVAHSSPVYIIVDGKPHWSPTRGPAIIAKQLAAIAKARAVHARIDDTRSRGMVERLDRAKAYYEKLLKEMKE